MYSCNSTHNSDIEKFKKKVLSGKIKIKLSCSFRSEFRNYILIKNLNLLKMQF